MRPAKMKLYINGEEYIAYGVAEERSDYVAFEVETLIKKSKKS